MTEPPLLLVLDLVGADLSGHGPQRQHPQADDPRDAAVLNSAAPRADLAASAGVATPPINAERRRDVGQCIA
jgi:hypothetical protein